MNICIDVGGTKTLVALFSQEGALIRSNKFPTPKDINEFFEQLIQTINELKPENPSAIGIAMPGLINRANGVAVSFGNLPWTNVPVREHLQAAFNIPVYLDNDANLAGLAEAHELDENDYPMVLYVTISTGIGTGAIYKHRIHDDLADSEGGAMHFMHDGKIMKWEHFASGKAIVAKYGKMASEIEDPETWNEIAQNLALGFSNMIAIFQPDAIVIGGGVGAHLEKFKEQLTEQMNAIAEGSTILRNNQPLLVKAQHPETAVVYGCHLLCQQNKG